MVVSDGCVFIPTIETWMVANEEKQIGIINYEKGVENFTLMVDIKNSSLNADEAFWIFPVPGDPEDADLDIIKDVQFYTWGEEDIRDSVKDDVAGNLFFMTITQTYIMAIPLTWLWAYGGMLGGIYNQEDLIIHEHVEKMGFTSELISANTSETINLYLEEKNINLTENADNIIDEYIGNDYSFVVSWISDVETFKKETQTDYHDFWHYYGEPFYILGVSVNFPTDEIYYPLKLTSIYDDEIIPVLIQINGLVTPKNTFNGMDTTYYYENNKAYTEITITTPSNSFTEDLWILNKAPDDVQTAKFIASNLLLISIIIFILCSILASIVSAGIVYFNKKPVFWKFTLLGLTNFLSIFFVFVSCLLFKINQKFVKKPVEKKQKVSKGFELGFRITFLVLGLICLTFFITSFFALYTIIIVVVFPLIFGILMFIYGGIKHPRVTLFTGLFSLFFFVFLYVFNTLLQSII
jgi:hypothetical protein